MSWKEKFFVGNRYFETENGILYYGDCLDILEKMSDNNIDLVITSPPYDELRLYKTENVREIWGFEKFKYVAKELYRVLKKGGVIVWIVNDAVIEGSESCTSFKYALYFKEKCGFKLHDTMIYRKNGITNFPDKTRYHQCFEYMFIFVKEKLKTFNPLIDRKNKYLTSWGTRSNRNKEGILVKRETVISDEYGKRFNIWKYATGAGCSASDNIAFEHPAIFPEKLAIDHITSWCNEGDIVLDIFMGSGTVGFACEKLNRRWIGIEINEEYCEIARKRIIKISEQRNLI